MQIHCAFPIQTFVQGTSYKLWHKDHQMFLLNLLNICYLISYNLHKVAQVVHLLPFFPHNLPWVQQVVQVVHTFFFGGSIIQ